jgi:hypothetical protein
MFNTFTYNIIGRLTGYVLAPLALLALVGPFTPHFPPLVAAVIGPTFIGVAVLLVICNIYLVCRRCVVEDSASSFPMFAALAGAGGVAALHGPTCWLPAILILAVLDLIGQPLLSAFVIFVTRLGPPPTTDH